MDEPLTIDTYFSTSRAYTSDPVQNLREIRSLSTRALVHLVRQMGQRTASFDPRCIEELCDRVELSV